MDLVIMAAGLGSRFGGNKQITPVDDDGNFIIDYSVHDAIKAGFDRIVFIIREEHQTLFEQTIGARLRKLIPIEYAFQKMDDVPDNTKIPLNRAKPWGTAHAVYSCRDIVSEKFAVINADDFYGFETFKIIYDFLTNSNYNQFVSAGYKAENTLSSIGSVKRGIFNLDGQKAVSIVESKLAKRNGKLYATPLDKDDWNEVPLDTVVSMSCFGFSRKLLTEIKNTISDFFNQPLEKLNEGEILLPEVVSKMLTKDTTLDVIPTKAKWYGMTYKDDLDNLKTAINNMKEKGEYPKHLYLTQN